MNTGESELDQLRRLSGQRAEALDRAHRRSAQRAGQIELLQIAHEQSKARIAELTEALRVQLESHPTRTVGYCEICHHFGDDCTANKATEVLGKENV